MKEKVGDEHIVESNNRYMALMQHCIGMDHRQPYKRHGRLFYRPYRNYYDASPKDCEDWDLIVATGYAKAGRKDRYGGRMYWLTREGLDWLGEKLGITIHCTSEEERQQVMNKLNERAWIPADEEQPSDDRYVLLSFSNFTQPMIGRYEQQEDGGGNWYIGDCDEGDTCLANDLYVNAWMELPKVYEEGRSDEEN